MELKDVQKTVAIDKYKELQKWKNKMTFKIKHFNNLIKQIEEYQEILDISQNKDWQEGDYEQFMNINKNKYEDMKALIQYLEEDVH